MTDHSPTDTRSPRYGQVDRDYATRLATTDPADDGPVWMVNLMHYRDVADYADGRDEQITGREADERYFPIDSLNAVGARPVFVGDLDQQYFGEAPVWDRVGVVKYPTRRAFIDMQARPEFQKSHEHKDAGMASTIVMGCQPIDLPPLPEADWSSVPNPPTDDDGPYVVLHVIRFDGDAPGTETPEHMQAYQDAASKVAVEQGIRIAGWFAVEGTIVGDGRSWHQVRFNVFPSKRAFMVVATDPDRLAAQHEHREVAIADTYALGLRPTLDDLADSLRA